MSILDKAIRAVQALFAGSNVWGFLTSPTFGLYVLGPALTAWAFVAGLAEGLETPYLLVACAALFGLVNWGFHQASLWLDRSKVQSKLIFVGVTNSQGILVQDANGLTLERIQYSVTLHNRSHFPIHFRVKMFRSTFSGRAQSEAEPRTTGTVMPNRPSLLGGSDILLEPPIVFARGDTRQGTLELEIEYWRWSWPTNRIRHNFITTFAFHQQPAQFSWDYDDNLVEKVSD